VKRFRVQREAVRKRERSGLGSRRGISQEEAETQRHREARRARGAELSVRKRGQCPRDVEREIAGEPAREFWFALGLMLVDKPQK
jgi:hypothetical protein